MTEENHAPEEHGHPTDARSEEDRIVTPKIIAVGVASLVVFALASGMTGWYLRTQEAKHPPLPIPQVIPSKIGIVEQTYFGLVQRGRLQRAEKLERLESYGWVDRSAGVAHVPISVAMDLVARGVRARPGAPAAPQRVPGGQP